jgi:hypothetical protein
MSKFAASNDPLMMRVGDDLAYLTWVISGLEACPEGYSIRSLQQMAAALKGYLEAICMQLGFTRAELDDKLARISEHASAGLIEAWRPYEDETRGARNPGAL